MERAIRFYRDTLGLELRYQSAESTTFRTGACALALQVIESRELGTAEPDPTFSWRTLSLSVRALLALGQGERGP